MTHEHSFETDGGSCSCGKTMKDLVDDADRYRASLEKFHRWIYKEILVDECWHKGETPSPHSWRCTKCKDWYFKPNRTFTTWEDFGAVFEKGKTKEWWHSFVKRIWEDTESVQFDYLDNYAFPQEYIDPKRFFTTLQEWWEREIKK